MATTPLSRRGFLAMSGLTALSLPAIAACGAGSEPSGGKIALEWWNIGTTPPQKTLVPQLAQAYTAAHPNVAIKPNAIENEAFKSKMTANTASGKLPDLFQTWGGGVLQQQIDAGLVEDLTPRFDWAADLTPASLLPFQLGGKIYAVPYNISMVGFWYNKQLFTKARITSPPTTWAAFLDVVGKLKSAGITPVALAGKDFTAPGFVTAGERLQELVALDPFQKALAAFGLPMTIVILRGFFRSIPGEIEEAAIMDGCSRLRFFWRILLPMARPALGTVSVLAIVTSWNDFFLPLLVPADPNWQTIPVGVQQVQDQYSSDYALILAYIVLATVPALAFYAVAERQLIGDLTAGATKG